MSAWSRRKGSRWAAYGTCLVGEGGGRRLEGKRGGWMRVENIKEVIDGGGKREKRGEN